jgi:type I restriction enzyme R subunit
VLCDRNGRSLAVVEAKKAAIKPAKVEDQAKAYAAQLGLPYIEPPRLSWRLVG